MPRAQAIRDAGLEKCKLGHEGRVAPVTSTCPCHFSQTDPERKSFFCQAPRANRLQTRTSMLIERLFGGFNPLNHRPAVDM